MTLLLNTLSLSPRLAVCPSKPLLYILYVCIYTVLNICILFMSLEEPGRHQVFDVYPAALSWAAHSQKCVHVWVFFVYVVCVSSFQQWKGTAVGKAHTVFRSIFKNGASNIFKKKNCSGEIHYLVTLRGLLCSWFYPYRIKCINKKSVCDIHVPVWSLCDWGIKNSAG